MGPHLRAEAGAGAGEPKALGTVYLVNGDTYRGEWRGAHKHGAGVYRYGATGSQYEGEWRNNQRHGHGTFSVREPIEPVADAVQASTDAAITLVAHRRATHGVAAGMNPMRKVDGARYDGDWRDDARHGFGRMEYAGGDVYEGEWRDGRRCGHGVLLLRNGDRYEGGWMDDMKDGHGRYIYKYKRQVYDGEWVRDVPRCGTVVDLPPLAGHAARPIRLPVIGLAGPDDVLSAEMREIQQARKMRMGALDL
ncbi:hypothetical protein SeLEV6574_g07866 [Synchytrium endobioticum]|uniref:MORN repeat-containing protein 3 n=1 Tax=Synchytrium endobioticum TaxID=286115 RepID=A0A507CF62_9FUNG|nr:hypothetical protein SeLEV6574_g07866 [Synchytrium endobioticum]